MLHGAIIGLIVGLIVTVVMTRRRAQAGKRVNAAFKVGGIPAAREVLDTWIPPVTGPVALSKLVETLERMAALAYLEDLESLETELGLAEGPLTVTVQVRAMGMVGMAVKGDDAALWAEKLEAEAVRVETEGGAMLKLVKTNTRNMADVVKELAGQGEAGSDQKAKLASYAGKMGPFIAPLLYQLLADATDASEGNSDQYRSLCTAAIQSL